MASLLIGGIPWHGNYLRRVQVSHYSNINRWWRPDSPSTSHHTATRKSIQYSIHSAIYSIALLCCFLHQILLRPLNPNCSRKTFIDFKFRSCFSSIVARTPFIKSILRAFFSQYLRGTNIRLQIRLQIQIDSTVNTTWADSSIITAWIDSTIITAWIDSGNYDWIVAAIMTAWLFRQLLVSNWFDNFDDLNWFDNPQWFEYNIQPTLTVTGMFYRDFLSSS